MKILLNLLLILFFITATTNGYCAQKDRLSNEIYHAKKWGISFNKPNEWIEISQNEALNNLEKIDFNEKMMVNILKSNRGTLSLFGFYKYNPKTHYGIIPTININVRINNTQNFEHFSEQLRGNAEYFKQILSNFKFVQTLKPIVIDNIQSLYFVGDYDLTAQDGATFRIRTSTYAIPRGKLFYQVNLIELVDGSNQDLFNSFIDSIKVN